MSSWQLLDLVKVLMVYTNVIATNNAREEEWYVLLRILANLKVAIVFEAVYAHTHRRAEDKTEVLTGLANCNRCRRDIIKMMKD